MGVTRIIPNLPVADVEAADAFYTRVFGLTVASTFGWIGFLTGPRPARIELHTVTRDASAPVDSVVSIAVDDLDDCHRRAVEAGAEIVHPITDEPWGVRRFFLRDPDGNVVNVVGDH